jgi:hypothetical protein
VTILSSGRHAEEAQQTKFFSGFAESCFHFEGVAFTSKADSPGARFYHQGPKL